MSAPETASKIRIVVNGAAGRMGRRLLALAALMPSVEVVGAIDSAGNPLSNISIKSFVPEIDLPLETEFSQEAEVLLDFSTPSSTVVRVGEAVKKKCALVVGTTGLTAEQEQLIFEAAQFVPVIHAANYSLGVNLMLKVAAEMAAALGDDFNVEISETHHNRKIDAPSGTALALAKEICAATDRDYRQDVRLERVGATGARPAREIGITALRLGSVVGEHTVYFGSEFERLELTHRAQNRDVFAAGALRAAVYLAGKKPGLYTMRDVLS
ncbi:4-hydroxy-tetrahydrodipicolinate reductase [Planctomycetales bacterium]|nr:4-hydroxy-tetrahydrodipicolinate reductase [Planctomycetales bacterium]GHT00527.1 4-hydroxy-tetrahydrodipicolinate reductase [Planctomycetales bacterium]GHT03352.1 4-hydroxy-tetrahydrodipicolinate reductase [Planctomycetales bacterium]GHV19989.1 4-hydroxy-tetrahydrodipicolinate reductase [Planctomycetales bacterium]